MNDSSPNFGLARLYHTPPHIVVHQTTYTCTKIDCNIQLNKTFFELVYASGK